MRKLGILAALVLTATLMVVLAAGPAASGNGTPSTTVVMTGLNNPRGLAFGPGGWLYVAEAGSGGTGACLMIRGANQCVGATGSVSRWKHGRTQQRVATGLPSYAPQISPPPDGATGPHDIGFDDGKGWITIGLGGDPAAIRAAFGNGFGRLAKMRRSGSWSLSTDIAAHEAAANPDRGPIDSNPYGILVGDDKKYVAEAGGNALLKVRKGSVSTVAAFPSRPQGRRTDSVPTAVIKGPGKSLLVAELTGGPFFPGEANIWRVERNGTATPYLTGFTTIIDIDWSCDGKHLYVLQIASGMFMAGPPVLLKVNPQTNERVQIAGPELTQPTSVLADCRHSGDDKNDARFADDDDDDDDDDRGKKQRRDVLYVSNKGTLPAVGEVLRLVR
jgi:hypothetical protein